jgi:predicted acyltransferase
MQQRLVSLDVLRGWTVALMILVNNPGSWAHVPAPLHHAAWHGCTPTDLVFPFFLFSMGGAMALSLDRRRAAGLPRAALLRQVLRRGLLILLLGLVLGAFPFGLPLDPQAARAFTPSVFTDSLVHLRIPGVLQRIALCWLLAASLIVIFPKMRHRAAAAGVLWLLYEVAMRAPLIAGWGAGSFAQADNFARWLDLRVLGEAHLLSVGGLASDPEGLLPTLTATMTTLLGFAAVAWLQRGAMTATRLGRLALTGAVLAAIGALLAPLEPVNKQLWTSTYVIVTGGLAVLALAMAAWLVDLRGWRRGLRPFEACGFNPLLVFWGSGLLARALAQSRWPVGGAEPVSLRTLLYRHGFAAWAGPEVGSVLFAIAMVALWMGVAWVLYRRGWAWRV